MQTDYDKLSGLFKELFIPAFYHNPLTEPKHIILANDDGVTKVKFQFDVNGKFVEVKRV